MLQSGILPGTLDLCTKKHYVILLFIALNEIDEIVLFQGAIHAFLTSDDFPTAVQKTIRAGGCCCSRSFFAGAMAGAR